MKIHSIFTPTSYAKGVREKPEGQGGGQSSGQNQSGYKNSKQDSKQDQNAPGNSEAPFELGSDSEIESKDIQRAVEAFKTDLNAQSRGLSADVEGDGPGLKVRLTDPCGSVIRRLSGEEFLQLREAVSSESRTSGKILDRKL